MNNLLREDIAFGILQKSHHAFHEQQIGTYLSQFTNDINEIKQRAWMPVYDLVGKITLVIASMIALTSLHWMLLAACLVTALLMFAIPKLFDKKLKAASVDFSQQQGEGLSKFKDLLSGYDVLRFFGSVEINYFKLEYLPLVRQPKKLVIN